MFVHIWSAHCSVCTGQYTMYSIRLCYLHCVNIDFVHIALCNTQCRLYTLLLALFDCTMHILQNCNAPVWGVATLFTVQTICNVHCVHIECTLLALCNTQCLSVRSARRVWPVSPYSALSVSWEEAGRREAGRWEEAGRNSMQS